MATNLPRIDIGDKVRRSKRYVGNLFKEIGTVRHINDYYYVDFPKGLALLKREELSIVEKK